VFFKAEKRLPTCNIPVFKEKSEARALRLTIIHLFKMYAF
jgi:hypothetical protein